MAAQATIRTNESEREEHNMGAISDVRQSRNFMHNMKLIERSRQFVIRKPKKWLAAQNARFTPSKEASMPLQTVDSLPDSDAESAPDKSLEHDGSDDSSSEKTGTFPNVLVVDD